MGWFSELVWPCLASHACRRSQLRASHILKTRAMNHSGINFMWDSEVEPLPQLYASTIPGQNRCL
eukprot:6364973-Amphidinium_carterae.1